MDGVKAEELLHLMGVDYCRDLLCKIDSGEVTQEQLDKSGITQKDIDELKKITGMLK